LREEEEDDMVAVVNNSNGTVDYLQRATGSTPDTKAWQTALAGAKGTLAYTAGTDTVGYDVVKYGSDDGAATATTVFGNKSSPLGEITVDRHSNTVTLTWLDPNTGKPAIERVQSGSSVIEQDTITEKGNGLVVNGPMPFTDFPADFQMPAGNFSSAEGPLGSAVAHFDFYGAGSSGTGTPEMVVDVADGRVGLGDYGLYGSGIGSGIGLSAVVSTPGSATAAGLPDVSAYGEDNSVLTLNDGGGVSWLGTSLIGTDYVNDTVNPMAANAQLASESPALPSPALPSPSEPAAPSSAPKPAPGDWAHIFQPWTW
jgi:hypothetical protein